ncbi:hypothetical protein N7493_002697 [Penicillium malachiteum]|uniref:Extracellular serine-threonine rich protein n=1 Tax=Penicillium malachiteum TaxID=1324776 RepID=A0AAD6HSW6_9EURO|nr:hypothetical protein N7493_002697 [Penicillium malachiteum]
MPLLAPTTSDLAPPSNPGSASVNPTEASLSTPAHISTVVSASVPNTEHTAPPLPPPRLTTSTVFTTQVHTVTACPAWIKDCPVSEKTTYYTTETVAAYTTVCPVAEEETTKPLSPPAAITKVHPGKPGEQFTTSIVYTTTAYPTKVCPSSIHHCSESQKTTTITTDTVVAYTTVCPVASEETTTAAVGLVATEHPAGPSGEKFTTSSVYTTTAYPTTVCPSSLLHCAESQKTVSTTTEVVLAYVTVCPVTATEEVGKTSALATATGPASEGENSSTTDTVVLSSMQTSAVYISVYSTLSGESATIGDTTTSESSSFAAIAGTKTFITGAESNGASIPEVDTSKPAYSNDSSPNGAEAVGFGSKTSLTGIPHGGTESWSPIKTLQHTSSSFAVSYSTTGPASRSPSAAISSLSSTSATPAAIFTGSASRSSAGSKMALCVLVAVVYFLF